MDSEKNIKVIASNVPFKKSSEDPPTINPLRGECKVSSGFGKRMHPIYKQRKMHTGIDFKAPKGTPILATSEGVIQAAKKDYKGKGNHVVIIHDDTYSTAYHHMDEIKVVVGQSVKKGEVIGTVGSTGMSTAPHLHYEVRVEGKAVDPIAYLKP